MTLFNIEKATGGGLKLSVVEASITGTGNIDTGLSTIVGKPVVCVTDAATSIPTDTASVTGVSGGTVSVVVVKQEASANSVETAAKNVVCFAIGY